MKYFNKLDLYKASNVVFNPVLIQAHSYGWWCFVLKIDNRVIFNDYNYSNTTLRHQSKVRLLMKQLGVDIDIVISCPGGLGNLVSAITYYKHQIDCLNDQISKPRSQKAKNEERQAMIIDHLSKIATITKLLEA